MTASMIKLERFVSFSELLGQRRFAPDDMWDFDEKGFIIEAISAGGHRIPAFYIAPGIVHTYSTYEFKNPIDNDTALPKSSNGWSPDELTLHWLKHFDNHAQQSSPGAARL
ncbi:hypothetical protein EX30DRAFT_374769 [Ascodesmis nigricans]|uniref:DDE-1 domain-containing protein n=1 Tax=Ascodesmis nigricans TaxID=341454 RepID=A0A4S2MR69_9PEZI|nr:hypothetical protein EX30DRAFT_374769 [Ascodesmis nigricans]